MPAPADTATVALAAGSMHTCAKLLSGSLVCWGDNDYGQLGTGDTTMRLGATGVSVGGGACHFSWYVFWNRCSSLFGELAAAASPLSLGGHVRHKHWTGMERPLRLYLPRALFLLFKRSNKVGEQYLLLTVVAQFFSVSLTAGATIAGSGGQYHTCAVQSAGSLMCWGSNAYGQLGTGDTVDRLTPTAVSVGVGTPARRPTCSFQSAILSRL